MPPTYTEALSRECKERRELVRTAKGFPAREGSRKSSTLA